MSGSIIGVDWGSTHVRAFRFDDAGGVIETRHSDRGAAGLAKDAFESAAEDLLAGWLTGSADKIVICGMAGSREGWIEAPYLACPTSLRTLSKGLVHVPGAMPALIVPGLCTVDPGGVHDVLRGEETQIAGAQGGGDACFITPGTHSKWIELRDGVISRFHTYMTGEFFKLLSTRSVLARTLEVDAAFDPAAFEQGAMRGLQGDALTKTAFAVRAQSLFNALTPGGAACYLSGLLIGSEIADGLSFAAGRRLVLIAAREIGDLYLKALAFAGVSDFAFVDGEAASATGLWNMAKGIAP